jgi:hypothetical protein
MDELLIRKMMESFINGDYQLSSFPDSLEKSFVLKNLKLPISEELSDIEIQDFEVRLEQAENDDVRCQIILELIDRKPFKTNDKLKGVLLKYEPLLLKLKRKTIETGKSLTKDIE